jgi:ABC-2 type transport system ATP-binding protein
MIASGSPVELTSGSSATTGAATIRLVVTEPFPPGAPTSLQRALGAQVEVRAAGDRSVLISGRADPTTLAKVSAWCEENAVLPESLNLGQRNLEDVFLELTGRELVP